MVVLCGCAHNCLPVFLVLWSLHLDDTNPSMILIPTLLCVNSGGLPALLLLGVLVIYRAWVILGSY